MRLAISLLLLAIVNAQAVSPIYGPSGNATVPGNVPILPVQAYVDNILSVLFDFTQNLNLANKGLTHFDGKLIFEVIPVTAGPNGWFNGANLNGLDTANLSGNAIPVADINSILAQSRLAQDNLAFPFILNLSGGTNAAPTGQGVTDKTFLNGHGWTVTTN